MEGFHSGEEGLGKGGVVSGEDLVADGDGNDLSGGDVGLDVGADPGEGFVGITDFGDAAVREADDELDAAVREGAEDGRNGVVELDASDVDGAEKRGGFTTTTSYIPLYQHQCTYSEPPPHISYFPIELKRRLAKRKGSTTRLWGSTGAICRPDQRTAAFATPVDFVG